MISPSVVTPNPVSTVHRCSQCGSLLNAAVLKGSAVEDKAVCNPPPEASSAKKRGGLDPCLIPPSSPSVSSPSTGETLGKDPCTTVKSRPENGYAAPGSGLWVLRRLQEGTERSVSVLRCWVHRKRLQEATHETAKEIASLAEEDALAALEELAGPKKFIRGGRGNQMDIPLIVTTLDDQRPFSIKALLDSGCTGSSIDAAFVQQHQINTRKFPRPIPVYNADGTLNAGGPISEFVEMRMRVQDHIEHLSFSVTNLGKSDMFLGHEWLQLHNPSIDWRRGTLEFDRCPDVCNYNIRCMDVEDASEDGYDPEAHMDEGDRLFILDYRTYLGLDHAHIRAKSTWSQELAEREGTERPLKTFQDIVPRHYHDFAEVFAKKEFESLPGRRPWDHAIELIPDASPVDCKVYPLSPEEQRQLDEFLEENLRSGRIRPSKSPMASPFFFVKKKDGTLRPVQDYRKLNSMTVKNRYPLPLIQELVDKLRGAQYFTKLDVRWGYNNVRIKEGDEWKAAFRTNRGLFEPLVMFFGLTNSPATFQTMMNDLFRDLISQGKVVVYLDDILIFSKTLEEHRQIVRQVLEILRKHKLYLKPEKCEFETTRIEYLGMIISQGCVEMDPVKIKGVAEWPEPTCKRDVQAFLGFTNFYRRFIQDYGRIAKPLTMLTGKTAWAWNRDAQLAFYALKQRVTSAPVLAIPTDGDPFRIECDASDFAIESILSQRQQEKWRPIAYLSKAMTMTERNYEIYDKELLAIMHSLEEWRQYLLGAKHTVEILTDHKNLEYFKKPQKLNRRQARWLSELADYNFTFKYKPGHTHKKPDLLSRRADHDRGDKDNENVVLLKPEWFRVHEVTLQSGEDLLDRVKRSGRNKDLAVIKALENNEPDWKEEGGIVTWKGRIYVPKNKRLREEIIQRNHDGPIAGHPGQFKTQELITRDFWWPRLLADVRRYIAGCEVCQRTKSRRTQLAAPLHPNEVPTRPWDIVSVDMIGPLPESLGYDAILNVVCMFSKQIISIPTNIELSALGWAKLYRDHVFCHHGLARKIVSDRGPQFLSKFIKDLYQLLGIQGNPSTAYHPQTDGQTERVNQEIEQYLRMFVNYHQNDWANWLPMAAFSYNNKIHTSTGFSPLFVNKGFHVNTGLNVQKEVKNDSAQTFVDDMKKIREEAESALKVAQETMKRFYDRKRQDAKPYQVGDLVWLEGYHIKTDRPMKKLEDKRYGPFKIMAKVGKSAYHLQLPRTWKGLHPVFNEAVLSPYTPPSYASQRRPLPPPPDIVNGEEQYEIEDLMDSKMERGKLKYLVKWKGYPREQWTWEPRENLLQDAKKIVEDFHKRHPNAPRPKPSELRFVKLENFTELTDVPHYLFNWEDGTFERAEQIARTQSLRRG